MALSLRKLRKFFFIANNENLKEALLFSANYFKRKTYNIIKNFLPSQEGLKSQIASEGLKKPGTHGAPEKNNISIITTAHNTDPNFLHSFIQSVKDQTYVNWELCICIDDSIKDEIKSEFMQYRGRDPRIKIVDLNNQSRVSTAINIGVEQATGKYLAFLGNKDTWDLKALDMIADALESNPQIDQLYNDEDRINCEGSPDIFKNLKLNSHFLLIRKSLFLKLGGMQAESTGDHDNGFALHTAESNKISYHIPKVLYQRNQAKVPLIDQPETSGLPQPAEDRPPS